MTPRTLAPNSSQRKRLCWALVIAAAFLLLGIHSTAMSNQRSELAGLHAAAGSGSELSSSSVVSVSELPLEERSLIVIVHAPDRPLLTVNLRLSDHPSWTGTASTLFGVKTVMVPEAILHDIENGVISGLTPMRSAILTSVAQDKQKVLRAETDAIAKEGYDFSAAEIASWIAESFRNDDHELVIEAKFVQPTVTVMVGSGVTKTFTLLATGLSDFSGSTANRTFNVHKAIEERVNNVYVPAGSVFSLVAVLDAPITLSKGWKEDLGLFGGGAALTPGAGICQSATTLFRGALLAGFPIVEKRNHSLFVDHYEPLGVGLDTTVFPGVHDFRFKNDTGHDLLIQAYIEGPTVYVNYFGVDDGRTAHLDGPYFIGSKNRPSLIAPLSNKQIGWVRTVTFKDGRTLKQPLIATYAKPVWHSVVKKFTGADGMKLMTLAGM